jgi:4-hydroxybutyrate CoA-transferase
VNDRDLARAFEGRWGTPDEVATRIEDGMTIASGLIEPTSLLGALAAREVGGTAVLAVLALGGLAIAQSGRFRIKTGFASPVSRALIPLGKCEYLPLLFSDADRYMRRTTPDSVLVRLSPPDAAGRCSYGWAAAFTPDLVSHARERGVPILAEIDPAMPRTASGREVPVEAIAAACLAGGDAASDTPGPPSRHAEAIARHVSPLIPDGATLQVGIGSVPDGVVERVEAHELGIHTEVLGPGLARLVEKGQATGARKSRDPGLAVCTIASVHPDVRALVDESERAQVRASSDVLDPRRIAEHSRLRCINSAMAVDLRGQVNAETLGWEQAAGVGGQLDFFRGAGMAEDGLRIVALASTTSRGDSRIVPGHPPGTVVTATRYDVDVIATEHGVAWMRDRTDEERARALIAIAHPDYRQGLERARFEGA